MVEIRLVGKIELMLERASAIFESMIGRKLKPEEIVELALERLLQELDSRYEYYGAS